MFGMRFLLGAMDIYEYKVSSRSAIVKLSEEGSIVCQASEERGSSSGEEITQNMDQGKILQGETLLRWEYM